MAQMGETEPRELAVIEDVACPGPAGDIPCRFYDSRESRDPGPAVLFLHGGGFVIGDLDVYHALCTEFAHRLDLPVLSVDYRLAPEHPWPTGDQDFAHATQFVFENAAAFGVDRHKIALTGDSAGGFLTFVTWYR